MSYVLVWVGRRTRWPAAALLPIALVATDSAILALPELHRHRLDAVLRWSRSRSSRSADLSALQAVVNGALFDALEAWRSGKPAPVGAMAASLVALLGSATYGYVRLVRVERVDGRRPRPPSDSRSRRGRARAARHPLASVRTLQDETAELHARGAELVIWRRSA